MPRRAAHPPASIAHDRSIAHVAPLLVAPELAELARLSAERDALRARILRLPACAHRRIILQDRLQGVVTRILRLEIAIYGRRD